MSFTIPIVPIIKLVSAFKHRHNLSKNGESKSLMYSGRKIVTKVGSFLSIFEKIKWP